MARRSVDDEDDDCAPSPFAVTGPRWEAETVANKLQDILDAIEAPPIDDEVRRTLRRLMYRADKYFAGDGREQVILLIRTISESEGNQDALVEPIVSAVSLCMRPEWTNLGLKWIEAFDKIPLTEILRTMRGLDLFSEQSIGHYFSIALRNKLWAILGPAVVPKPQPKPVKVKAVPKPPVSVTRIPAIEKKIAIGMELLELRSKAKWNNEFGRLRRKMFDVDGVDAQEALRVARVYGQRPEIYRRLSWQALIELSSPSLPVAARQQLEARILAGEGVSGKQIASIRGPLPTGRPKWVRERARNMAA